MKKKAYTKVAKKPAKSVLFVDVMNAGRYVCTIKYEYCPLFAIKIEELEEYVYSQRPSLRGKDITFCLEDNRIPVRSFVKDAANF